MVNRHFLLVTFPAQGHLNPALQFAKRVVRMGATVTLATSISARRRMSEGKLPEGLTFATFSDGHDDGFKRSSDVRDYMAELKRRGSKSLAEIIEESASNGRPVSCLVYTLLLPWAAKLARDHHIPSALLWIQPATVLDIYYYYFNGYREAIKNIPPSSWMELPGLPLSLAPRDIPSFLNPSNAYANVLPSFQEQLEALEEEASPTILVNSFDALEPEGLNAIERFKLIAIGPLIPSAFLDRKDPSDRAFGADLFRGSKSYLQWLDSQGEASVVYISFGSISRLSKRQKEEVARALLGTGRPFLWVIRSRRDDPSEEDGGEEEDAEMSCKEELEKQGMIVPWCSQVEVLSHSAVGCFVSHCGWNSTMESLVSGVPVAAFPQWTDQTTNAKLLEDVWRTGVRVTGNAEGFVEGEEIRRCLEMVMGEGERGAEMRENAKKWKELAKEAVTEGGSSETNLRDFVDKVGLDAMPAGKVSL